LSLEELEALIVQRETRIATLEAEFADPVTYRDGAAVARLQQEFDTLKQELAQAEAEWERRIDQT
jgi:hypothetical protein